jgi:hypothetical protein
MNRNTCHAKTLQLKLEATDCTQKKVFTGTINCHGFKPVDKKKLMPFLFFLFAFSNICFAQQAYHGGSGDGYASATAKNLTLDINCDLQMTSIQFNVYPNPATENRGITVLVKETGCRLQVYAADGKTVYSFTTQNSETISLNLPAGTYFLKIEDEDAFSVQKLIVLPGR